MGNTKQCPICHNKADSPPSRGRDKFQLGMTRHNCKTCGHYTLTISARDDIIPQWRSRQDTASLAKLSAFIKEQTLLHPKGIISLRREGESAEGLPGDVFTLDEALKRFPRSISERINRALLNLALQAPKLYTLIHLHPHSDYPIFYAEDGDEQRYMIEILKKRYLTEKEDTIGDVIVSLTAEGWQRIDELQRGTAEKPRQGFVAMWFDDSMQDARKRGFIAAIDEAGYDPKIIDDRDDFNGDIHDQILAEIRKSRFIVADFTDHRPNVYYEAGFAEALGKPVIYTCRKDHFDEKQNFDIRQQNHILWEESDELRKRLYRRIEATIGLPAS